MHRDPSKNNAFQLVHNEYSLAVAAAAGGGSEEEGKAMDAARARLDKILVETEATPQQTVI